MRSARVLLALLLALPAGVGADGVLDPTFGSGGIVVTTFPSALFAPNAIAFSAVVQPDGRTVVAGTTQAAVSTTSGGDVVLARYEANGALDPTFGVGGRVASHLGAEEFTYDCALQPDGKIVVVGTGSPMPLFVARYLPDGALDPAFGVGGVARPALPGVSEAFAVAVEVDAANRIVVAAISETSPRLMTAFRLEHSGGLDSNFGTAGVTTVDPSGNGTGGTVLDLAIQPDGRIVLAGMAQGAGPDEEVAVVRLTASGSLDGSFGTGGIVRTDAAAGDDDARAVALQDDGKIVVTGRTLSAGGQTLVVRYSGVDGAPDASFGTGGVAVSSFAFANEAEAVVVQPDGNIVVAGTDGLSFVLARFTSGGILDPSFGTGGVIRTNIAPGVFSVDEAYELLIPFPGALLAVGRTGLNPSSFALARYSAATPVALQGFSVE